MEAKNETMVLFYQLLGRIFYGAAQADNSIRPEEIEQLKKIVKDVWVDAEDTFDQFDSDSAYQIEIVFDFQLNNDIIENDVLNDLVDFKKTHLSLFTSEVNEMIMNTVYSIISAFAKRNKSELVFLTQLRMILEKSD